MLLRFFIFFLGIVLCSLGATFTIIYLNLLNMGYSFLSFVNFIIRRIECLLFFLGVLLIFLSIYKRKEK